MLVSRFIKFSAILIIVMSVSLTAVSAKTSERRKSVQNMAQDFHSYSNPNEIRVTNIDLDLDVLFEQQMLKGTAVLSFERKTNDPNTLLNLDTRDLNIEKVETSSDGGKSYLATKFRLGETDKFLGTPLVIEMPVSANRVRIFYSTSPNASGLQWLTPEQTAGKKTPFMFSQAQAIHARSFIPLQDSPQVRVTFSAKIRTPKGLLAVMSAEGNSQNNESRGGEYSFKMPHPIPSYLIAIAVGDLKFQSLGSRTGVYSEPSMLGKSAYELADTEKMVEATEKIYGKYRWGRYDLLVLPPSFPFGGMENPMLTFATPTILAGDRSLVSLVAHELAHSWSGNLVTNATWRDFWLNEGFTTYLERRIIEAVYGVPRREMEATLGKRSLLEELSDFDVRDQIMHVDLKGRDPDDGFTGVPYEKGALFLRHLEETVGRNAFDKFVRGYFDSHAFQSITTEDFIEYLDKNLIAKYPKLLSIKDAEEWINEGGLPKNAPSPKSDAFTKVEIQVSSFLSGKTAANALLTKGWTTQEWLHFLKSMPETLGAEQMSKLDLAFNFTKSGNSEIAFQWLMMSIKNDYAAADARLEDFLITIGRRKFVKPLFAELAKSEKGMMRACEIYAKSRAGYHPITQTSVDAVVKCNE